MHSPLHESRFFALLRGSLILLIVPLVGCLLHAKKHTALPPAPSPAAVQTPAPEVPLSIPQTAVMLPSSQPVNPDAIPKVQTAQEVPAPERTDPPPTPRASRRTVAAGPPKPEPEAEAEAPPPPPVQEQAPIQPILNGDELKRIKNLIDARKKEINEKLGRVRGLTDHDKSLVERIRSFLEQCEQAETRSDFSQADALSERALILARELQGE